MRPRYVRKPNSEPLTMRAMPSPMSTPAPPQNAMIISTVAMVRQSSTHGLLWRGNLAAELVRRNWPRQGLFNGPAVPKSSKQHVFRHLQASRPDGGRQLFAAKFEQAVIAGVAVLRTSIGPSAIARLIVSIDVDAIQRIAWRASAHISQELNRVIAPGVAHLDAAASIVRVTAIGRRVASCFCALPRFVFAALRLAVRRSHCSSHMRTVYVD